MGAVRAAEITHLDRGHTVTLLHTCSRSVRFRRGSTCARAHRRQRQSSLPRGDDVRRVGQHRSRRVDSSHPSRAGRRHQLRRHGRRLLAWRVGGDRGQGAEGTPRLRGAGHEGPRLDARHRSEHARQLAPVDRAGGRGESAPPADRLDRPLPDPPLRPVDRPRGDARRAHGPPARGQDPLPRLLDLPAVGDRRGAVGLREARPRAVRLRAASVLPTRARHRARGAAGLRALRAGRHPVEPARGRLALGPVPQGSRRLEPPGRANPGALRPGGARGTSRSSRPSSASRSSPNRPASASSISPWRSSSGIRR